MKIYTKTGDEGATGLIGGVRVSKDHPRIEAYGTVDELNAALGWARSQCQSNEQDESSDVMSAMDELLSRIQNELFAVGAELAAESQDKSEKWIHQAHIDAMEKSIDDYESRLKPLDQFILPAGNSATASLHVARSICRRAERRVVTLGNQTEQEVSSDIVVYLNRLGDLLFVLARSATMAAGLDDVPWQKPKANAK